MDLQSKHFTLGTLSRKSELSLSVGSTEDFALVQKHGAGNRVTGIAVDANLELERPLGRLQHAATKGSGNARDSQQIAPVQSSVEHGMT